MSFTTLLESAAMSPDHPHLPLSVPLAALPSGALLPLSPIPLLPRPLWVSVPTHNSHFILRLQN